MQGPLSAYNDCAVVHYRLQLNLYKYILEANYGMKVDSMRTIYACGQNLVAVLVLTLCVRCRIVDIHPDQEGRPYVVEVDDLMGTVYQLLEDHT
eukprot:4981327-Amphidinium_carterae.4